jgi:KDO2-lipid IV(A) lauroyltransferase
MTLGIIDTIKYQVVRFILKSLAYLPLPCLRYLGRMLGILMSSCSKRAYQKLKNNLLRTNICDESDIVKLSRIVSMHLGMMLVETVCISWYRSKQYNFHLCNKISGFTEVEKVCEAGFPVLFLTPHIGNFEVVLKRTAYLLQKKKFTVLYKPDKNKWWNKLMLDGRLEDNIVAVPTNKKGILSIFKALKNREVVGILPDSIASEGDGVWTDFFGNRVFATTLAAKLALMPGVKTFIVASVRNSTGFEANYIPFSATSNNITKTVEEIYQIIEEIVKKHPEQFYWSYDRFRIPKHAPIDVESKLHE